MRSKGLGKFNHHIADSEDRGASVTYDVSRLQNHASPTPILVTYLCSYCG